MACESLLGSVFHGFVLRLLEPTETLPREHGRRLIVTGAVSLGLWLAVVGGGMLLIPESEPQPDILPASPAIQVDRAGRLVEPAEPDRADRPAPRLRGILFTAGMLCILAFVFWGAYSSLYIAAGLFECCAGSRSERSMTGSPEFRGTGRSRHSPCYWRPSSPCSPRRSSSGRRWPTCCRRSSSPEGVVLAGDAPSTRPESRDGRMGPDPYAGFLFHCYSPPSGPVPARGQVLDPERVAVVIEVLHQRPTSRPVPIAQASSSSTMMISRTDGITTTSTGKGSNASRARRRASRFASAVVTSVMPNRPRSMRSAKAA